MKFPLARIRPSSTMGEFRRLRNKKLHRAPGVGKHLLLVILVFLWAPELLELT
jgi:hypothetical protein